LSSAWGRKIATYLKSIRELLSGVGLALTGVVVVELFLAVGMRLYSPVGWPGFGMIAGAAFFGVRGMVGGAVVVLATYIVNRLRPERFASFYDGAGPSVAWLVAIVVLSLIAAVLSARLRRVERESVLERGLHESEERLRTITDNLPGLVAYIDDTERYQFASAAYENWVGLRPDRMRGRTVRELWGEERYAMFQPNLQRALRGERVSYEYSVTNEGRDRRMLATYTPDRDGTGKIRGIFVLSSDVTELVRARNEAREAHARLESALDHSSVALWDADLRNNRIYLSDAWGEIIGNQRGEIISTVEELGALVHPDDLEATRRGQLETMKGLRAHYVMEHRVRAGRDGWRWILSRGRVTERDPATGRALRMVGTNVDITDRKRVEEALQSVASTDPLTGLANRTALADRISLAVARCRRNGTSFALLYLDLDRFKEVNDSMGHSAGDKLLVQFAMRLRSCVRASDSVARLGGDEFVVLLDDLKEREAAVRIAEKILQETRTPVRIDARQVAITTSIGIAHYVTEESGEDLLQRADSALYRAKRAGRDAYCLA
jgi:diguanylate cyclase (GGDEF)-like protein/PAS domain S-box-containing protein